MASVENSPPELAFSPTIEGRRARHKLEHGTSLEGVFAIGDVRSGSVKRVGAAIGEGAAVVSQIHSYLALHPAEARSAAA